MLVGTNFSSSNILISKWFSPIIFLIEKGNFLIHVPSNSRIVKLVMGSKISGKFFNFEQPEIERVLRDLILQMVVGKLTSFLQSLKINNSRWGRHPIVEGTSSIPVMLKTKHLIFFGSFGNLFIYEQPSRLRVLSTTRSWKCGGTRRKLVQYSRYTYSRFGAWERFGISTSLLE